MNLIKSRMKLILKSGLFIFLTGCMNLQAVPPQEKNPQLPSEIYEFVKDYYSSLGSGNEEILKSFLSENLIKLWGPETISNLSKPPAEKTAGIQIMDWVKLKDSFFVQWKTVESKPKFLAWYQIKAGGPRGFQLVNVGTEFDPRDTAK
ncbi:MAG: hypothetical protein J0L93_11380 [Deltaproteobacteria bacterium]|nr:hypothetical protein [Deltaproteobacteria bacterium]